MRKGKNMKISNKISPCCRVNRELFLNRDLPDVLLLVFLRHGDVRAAGLQIVLLNFTENLKVCTEVKLQADIIDVVVSTLRKQ